MSVTVYIWNNSATDVGHASLEVSNGAYISFWPKGNAGGKGDIKMGDQHDTHFPSLYKADRRHEGRDADQSIIIEKLDEKEITTRWVEFKKDSSKKYNMKNANCSTIVATFLEIGSGVPPANSPRLSISKSVGNKAMQLILKLRFLGNYIDMWSPNAVATYALQIKSDKTP